MISRDGKLTFNKLISMPETKDVCLRGLDNELGHLSQSFKPNNITGMNTICFVQKSTVPLGQKIIHANFVFDLCPSKKGKILSENDYWWG